MGTKTRELDNTHEGDRHSCPICNPNGTRIRHDQVWGGEYHLGSLRDCAKEHQARLA